jgi:pimeloyl-ACP methyl ester carboxylesterase
MAEDWGGARAFTAWTFESRGLELAAWDIAGERADGAVVILTHGWGDSRVGGLSRVEAVVKAASRVILWDMAGHGESQGRCTLGVREVEDLLALIEKVRGESGVVLYGWSLGAGVSIAAATRSEHVRAVVAESAYRLAMTPARAVIQGWGLPWRINLPLALAWVGWRAGVGVRWRGFDRAEVARGLRVPMLVLHGEEDGVSPVEDGRAIAEAGRGVFVALAGAGHHGMWTGETRGECVRVVGEFVERVAGVTTRPGARG